MGKSDLFQKRRQGRKKRRHEYREPRANSFLIVTEGKCTEPSYFKGMRKIIQERIGGMINIVEVPLIEIRGQGRSTGKLIDITEQIVKNAKIMYQNVWVVFDKDDFDDFDKAIQTANSKGYQVAWSNQSFEYWIYLHFYYSDAALHRNQWIKKLDDIFKQRQLGTGEYLKNCEDIFELVCKDEGIDRAIRNAKRRMENFDENRGKPSEFDPGTTVYKLVEELKKFIA